MFSTDVRHFGYYHQVTLQALECFTDRGQHNRPYPWGGAVYEVAACYSDQIYDQLSGAVPRIGHGGISLAVHQSMHGYHSYLSMYDSSLGPVVGGLGWGHAPRRKF